MKEPPASAPFDATVLASTSEVSGAAEDSKEPSATPAKSSPPPCPESPTVALSPIPARPKETLDDLVGTSLRHYEIESLLGRGGMGSVFLGRDTSLDRKVALKVLDPEVGVDPDMVARFVREARSQASIDHPNITQIYFVGEDRGFHFFAMEFVKGQTLEARLKEGRLPWPRAVEIATSVARGLQKAREQGFVHRDIKPSNLLIDSAGQVKIADFGLVKNLESEAELTREGMILGSPLYMSPEQGRSESADHRSDIYSLGCVLYHMLTGGLPFSGPTAVTIITKHVTDTARPIRVKAPRVPPDLEEIVERMMAKEPAKRPQGYEALIEDLESVLPGRHQCSGLRARAIAAATDWALFVLAAFFIGYWAALAAAVYFIVMHGLLGWTLGKALMGLRVRDLEGLPIGWKAAVVRFALSIWGPVLLSLTAVIAYHTCWDLDVAFRLRDLRLEQLLVPGAAFGLLVMTIVAYLGGLLIAAVHPRKQALHDLAARTEVTLKRTR